LLLRHGDVGEVGSLVSSQKLPILGSDLFESWTKVDLLGLDLGSQIVVKVLILGSLSVQIFRHIKYKGFLKII
jgi:hypothetical protein